MCLGRWVVVVAFVSLCGGCSTQQVYEGIQSNRKFDCQKNAPPSQQQDCNKRYSQSYDSYESERKESQAQP